VNSMHPNTDKPLEQAPTVPDRADDLRDLGEWLIRLAPALGRMPQQQRRALLNSTDGLRRDLAAINLAVRS
jgi:hypothetical protein